MNIIANPTTYAAPAPVASPSFDGVSGEAASDAPSGNKHRTSRQTWSGDAVPRRRWQRDEPIRARAERRAELWATVRTGRSQRVQRNHRYTWDCARTCTDQRQRTSAVGRMVPACLPRGWRTSPHRRMRELPRQSSARCPKGASNRATRSQKRCHSGGVGLGRPRPTERWIRCQRLWREARWITFSWLGLSGSQQFLRQSPLSPMLGFR